jgi:hypothetical protein
MLIAGLGFGLVCAMPLLIIGVLRNRHSEAVNLQLQRENAIVAAERKQLQRKADREPNLCPPVQGLTPVVTASR